MQLSFPTLNRTGVVVILIPFLVIGAFWGSLPTQDRPEYFQFADQVSRFGIPHFLDVMTNAFFVFAGLAGLRAVTEESRHRVLLRMFSVGLICVGFGSAYFHWDPTPSSLFWDRLPMGVCFGTLVTLLLADRTEARGLPALAALIIGLSVWSVWNVTFGYADLRPYYGVQAGTILVAVLVALFARKGRIPQRALVLLIVSYVLAKWVEGKDHEIQKLLGAVTGHNTKHLLAATGCWLFVRNLGPARSG